MQLLGLDFCLLHGQKKSDFLSIRIGKCLAASFGQEVSYMFDWSLRALLYFIVLSLFVVTAIALAIKTNLGELSTWSLLEAIINYSGGFVRRGLLGEIFSYCDDRIYCAEQIQKVTFVSFLALFFAILLDRVGEMLASLATLVLIFGSGGLFDMLAAEDAADFWGRKEIYFYTFLVILSYSATAVGPPLCTFLAIVGSIVLILTHELFYIIFSPVVAIFIFAIEQRSKLRHRYFFAYIVLTSFAFGLVVAHSGDAETARVISLDITTGGEQNFPLGAVNALSWGLMDLVALSLGIAGDGYLTYWLVHIVVAITSVFALYYYWWSTSVAPTFPIFSFAWLTLAFIFSLGLGSDWGRGISIYTVGSALCVFLFPRGVINTSPNVRKDLLVCYLFLFISFAFGLFLVPRHCCTHSAQVTIINPLSDNISSYPGSNSFDLSAPDAQASAIQALLLLGSASATLDGMPIDAAPNEIARHEQLAVRLLQLALRQLQEAANSGLSGSYGERVAQEFHAVMESFRAYGLID